MQQLWNSMTTKQKAISASILVLMFFALTMAGSFAMRIRTYEKTMAAKDKELTTSQSQLKEEQLKSHQLSTQLSTSKSTYERKLAALNAAGQPLLDGHGNPIFNEERGSADTSELMQKTLDMNQKQILSLSSLVVQKDSEIQTLTQKVSRPGMSAWDFSLGYSLPISMLGAPALGATWAGAGWHFPFLGADVGIRVEGGLGALERAAKVDLVFRP